MADKKLKIVDKEGRLAIYQGQKMIFDPNSEGKVSGLNERERAQNICWLLNRNASNGPFEIKEFEDTTESEAQ